MGGRVAFRRGNYNPTSDAVWLAAFAAGLRINGGDVLDAGVGTGAAALCLLAHCPDMKVAGIDNSEEMLAECAENARLNNRRIELIQADILKWKTSRAFDLVMTNPPYFKGTSARHGAHHNADLPGWTRKCAGRLRPGGFFCAILDTAAVADVISALNPTCGDIAVFPLFGSKNSAERVIIGARKGSKGPAVIFKGLSMNDESILRGGLTIGAGWAKLCQRNNAVLINV